MAVADVDVGNAVDPDALELVAFAEDAEEEGVEEVDAEVEVVTTLHWPFWHL